MLITDLLLALLLSLTPSTPAANAAAVATEVALAFEAGDLTRLMRLWSDDSPTRIADRKRLTRLATEGGLRLVATADGDRVRLELRDQADVPLERYTLTFRQEREEWRAWSLVSENESGDPRMRARELLHRGAERLASGDAARAAEAFAAAAESADASVRAVAERGLGEAAFVRRDVEAAAAHFDRSLAAARSAGDRRSAARALERQASIDDVTGNVERAESRLQEALGLARETGGRLLIAQMLVAVGNVHTGRAEHQVARRHYDEALAIYEAAGDLNGIAVVLNTLGVNRRLQGNYREATVLFTRSLELHRALDNLQGTTFGQGNLGIAYAMQGQYAEAARALRETVVLAERLGRPDVILNALVNSGEMYRLLGNAEQAREHIQKALAIAEQTGHKSGKALVLHNLAQLHNEEGDFRGALTLLEESLALDTAVNDRAGMALTLHNIGRVHLSLGDRDAARAVFDRSRALSEEIGDREALAIGLSIRGDITEDPDEAIAFATRGLALATEMGLPERRWEAHVGLGRAYRRAKRLDEARVETERGIAIVEELRRGLPGGEVQQQQAFESMARAYQEMVGLLVESGDVAGAFEHAERAKARVLLDVLRNGRPDLAGVITAEERAREEALAAELTRASRVHRDALMAGTIDGAITAPLRKARLEYDDFVAALYTAHPQLRFERGELEPLSAAGAAAALGSAADALVEYVVTEERTYVFTLTPESGLRVATIPISRDQLREEVGRFRALLAGRNLTYATEARALYDRLLKPVAAQLEGAKTICIVADGPLWELPFQALQPKDETFVLDRHALFYAPSLTTLREMTARRRQVTKPRDVRLLAFGNPVIPRDAAHRAAQVFRDVSLEPLPQTETEIRRIATLYGTRNSRVHLRGDAREERVKSEAATFDVLHFATHGLLDDQNALYSRLVFSPSSSKDEDGLLEAREIMRLNLRADLAVLSACETGRGRVGTGEGMIGMSWALFVAGVPTSVVSQWKVDSASTTELMIDFHRALRTSTRSKAEAMQKAALKTRAKYRHPFFWAPFVVIGTP